MRVVPRVASAWLFRDKHRDEHYGLFTDCCRFRLETVCWRFVGNFSQVVVEPNAMQRLKTRVQFQAVLAGATVSRTVHFALHRAPLDSVASAQSKPLPEGVTPKHIFPVKDAWMGAMVPKRWAKRAVTRNAIKRQIYNVSSILESSLKPMAHVVRLRSGFDKKHYPSATSDALKAVVCAELNQLFAKVSGAGAGESA